MLIVYTISTIVYRETALYYLELADQNIEHALNLYLQDKDNNQSTSKPSKNVEHKPSALHSRV